MRHLSQGIPIASHFSVFRRMRRFGYMFIFCLIFSMNSFAAQNVYKWTDAEGNVHYGSKPEQQSAERVNIAPPPKSDPIKQQRKQALQEQQQQRDYDQQYDEQRRKEIAEAQEYQRKVREVCAQYQNNMRLLKESGRRIYTVDAEGEYHYFSDEERQQEMEDLQRKIERHCVKKPD